MIYFESWQGTANYEIRSKLIKLLIAIDLYWLDNKQERLVIWVLRRGVSRRWYIWKASVQDMYSNLNNYIGNSICVIPCNLSFTHFKTHWKKKKNI